MTVGSIPAALSQGSIGVDDILVLGRARFRGVKPQSLYANPLGLIGLKGRRCIHEVRLFPTCTWLRTLHAKSRRATARPHATGGARSSNLKRCLAATAAYQPRRMWPA